MPELPQAHLTPYFVHLLGTVALLSYGGTVVVTNTRSTAVNVIYSVFTPVSDRKLSVR